MAKYRKLPVIIDAYQWTGDEYPTEYPEWVVDAIRENIVYFQDDGYSQTSKTDMCIQTLEGTMVANRGDYIIKGIKGEIYPCKEDIFIKSYEVV